MTTVAVRTSWNEDLATSARRLSVAIVGGLVSGAVVGGLGGRLAMLVLRITSDDYLHGLDTDDGFVMGQISTATLFLVGFTSVLGVFGALLYVSVRGWLPERRRAALTGVFGGIVGGAAFIRSDGIDFRLLEPLPLAIVLFIALPAAYGVAMSLLVERRLRNAATTERSRWWALGLLPLIAVGLIGPPGLGVLLLVLATWTLHRWAPEIAALWRSGTVMWIGRSALLAVTAFAVVGLVRDITRIL
ncbi:MAG: hypothetical protein ABI595_09520 [Actinomycetota bacterium]